MISVKTVNLMVFLILAVLIAAIFANNMTSPVSNKDFNIAFGLVVFCTIIAVGSYLVVLRRIPKLFNLQMFFRR